MGPGYEAPLRWNGELTDGVVEVTGELRVDPLKEFERIMTEHALAAYITAALSRPCFDG